MTGFVLLNRWALSIALLVFFGNPAFAGSDSMEPNEKILYRFETADELDDWRVVNDGVMGGLSQSRILSSGNDSALFQGEISLANNGGFSSTRTRPQPYDLDGFSGMILRVKGDGQRYQFRLRVDNRFDGVAYRYHFDTTREWQTIQVPFAECVPTFRGRVLDNVDPLSAARIQQIGFLISDKQAGPFALEIDWIKAYR